MANVLLEWEYDESGPLPKIVEIYRNDVVIATFNTAVTSYNDETPSSMQKAIYKVKSIYNQYFAFSDEYVIDFVDFNTYDIYIKMTTEEISDSSLIPTKSPSGLSFGTSQSKVEENGTFFDPVSVLKRPLVSSSFQDEIALEMSLSGDFTIELKIKTMSSQQIDQCVLFEFYNSNSVWSIMNLSGTGQLSLRKPGETLCSTGVDVFDGIEHKIVFQRTGNTIDCYVDDLKTNFSTWGGTATATYGNIKFGGYYAVTESEFYGYIRDFAIAQKAIYG